MLSAQHSFSGTACTKSPNDEYDGPHEHVSLAPKGNPLHDALLERAGTRREPQAAMSRGRGVATVASRGFIEAGAARSGRGRSVWKV